ncbi:5-formyltetrahydrofolate cyclo-ligase [Vallicoccus soli]|uniref:5-formyltetrahydrofolate cyclo-ligase n=1 Tax=Vallicoccus soli TaxID=2339232 RepID=UPI001C497E87|nr:5-formyltetrahydrofolate cyclo-ligase [Vallicoccus soli]
MTPSAAAPATLSPGGGDVRAAKAALRRRLLAARRAAGPAGAAEADALAAAVLALLPPPGAPGAGTVAAYAAAGTEPPTAGLLVRLRAAGWRVLLPVLREDDDLDWAAWDGGPLVPGRRGLREPAGPRLGREAVAGAGLVVVPALAVGRDGTRLGRGGGSYDRALARARRAPVVALLRRGELLDAVPAEPHDARVHLAVDPGGAHRLSAPGAGGG